MVAYSHSKGNHEEINSTLAHINKKDERRLASPILPHPQDILGKCFDRPCGSLLMRSSGSRCPRLNRSPVRLMLTANGRLPIQRGGSGCKISLKSLAWSWTRDESYRSSLISIKTASSTRGRRVAKALARLGCINVA